MTICLDKSCDFSFNNTITFFLTSTKKYSGPFVDGRIIGTIFPKYKHDQERFDLISNFFIDKIKEYGVTHSLIEDYAFGGKGKVFNLAENTGLLKHKLWKNNQNFTLRAPSAIKKFSTGKGNANKDLMYYSFFEETSVDLFKKLSYTKEKVGGPISDIVDSYFMCKLLFSEKHNSIN